MKEIDLGQEEWTKIVCGSHNKIVIEKLYGPACVQDLTIVWEGDDWNVRNQNRRLRKRIREMEK